MSSSSRSVSLIPGSRFAAPLAARFVAQGNLSRLRSAAKCLSILLALSEVGCTSKLNALESAMGSLNGADAADSGTSDGDSSATNIDDGVSGNASLVANTDDTDAGMPPDDPSQESDDIDQSDPNDADPDAGATPSGEPVDESVSDSTVQDTGDIEGSIKASGNDGSNGDTAEQGGAGGATQDKPPAGGDDSIGSTGGAGGATKSGTGGASNGGASDSGEGSGGTASGGTNSGGSSSAGSGTGGTAEPVGLELVSSVPGADAEDVDPMSDLVLTFNDDVSALSGNIQIVRSDDDALFDEIAIDDARVSIDGDSVSVDLDGILGSSTVYYVTIDSGIVEDTDSDTYAGISDDTELRFTTISAAPAEVSPGLIVWLDADYAGSITTSSTAVTQWGDRSGNNFHVGQATSTKRPTLQAGGLNSKNVIRFDGVNDWLQGVALPDLEEYELVAVWQNGTATVSTHAKILSRAENFEINYGHSDVNFRCTTAAVFGSDWQGARFEVPIAGAAHLWDASFSAEALTLSAYTDGALSGTNDLMTETALGSLEPLAIGSNHAGYYPLKGDVAEVMIYDAPLSDDERDSVEAYVETKWGIDTSP